MFVVPFGCSQDKRCLRLDILISYLNTGADGFIGTRLVKELYKQNYGFLQMLSEITHQ
jgi:hypothetical protein